MPVSAHDVARELRTALPGIGVKKLHKLLYLSQGHHVAWFGQPLFNESIHAYDMGPVVDRLWRDEKAGRSVIPVDLDEAALNTVLYVASRYGALTGRDLEILSHGQDPWQDAEGRREAGGSDLIDHESLGHFFDQADRDDETPWPDDASIATLLSNAQSARGSTGKPDDVERLRARARGE